ncbi:MAG: D-sedoheptulose 7-phosphate isomerase [Deltaproteobacteria bacterium]|nr:D-sedoheptulose 7-phosphate isomerase [Deltaproteobacteria bacterium]
METEIRAIFGESARVRDEFLAASLDTLIEIVYQLIDVIKRGDKVLLFGNGGSAADAQHVAAEFVNRYRIERRPLPALALTTDTSVLTAIGNDYDFSDIFAKQIAALGRKGDAAIGISTSGRSANVNKGLRLARELGLITVGFGGAPDSEMSAHCDHYLSVYGSSTPRIQETHMIIGHTIVEMLDMKLFGSM